MLLLKILLSSVMAVLAREGFSSINALILLSELKIK
jgi:hypothetical protein